MTVTLTLTLVRPNPNPNPNQADGGELGRHWIVYNRPGTRQHAHAGFLMGLGLQGHLLALANTDLYRYMSQGHDVTMMAVLLGMRTLTLTRTRTRTLTLTLILTRIGAC